MVDYSTTAQQQLGCGGMGGIGGMGGEDGGMGEGEGGSGDGDPLYNEQDCLILTALTAEHMGIKPLLPGLLEVICLIIWVLILFS
jgi:hypothetical protein